MKNKFNVIIVVLTINITSDCIAQNWTWTPPLLWTVTDNVGIGTAMPAFKLDVSDNMNLDPNMFAYPETGYRWNSEVVLKTSNTTENIFLGNNAGDAAGGGTANTFLGAYSGEQHSGNGGGNTFVGWNTGSKGTNTSESVYLGSRAGEFNDGSLNCFVGVLAGNGVTLNTSSGNSFFGNSAGRINTGNNNTFIGNSSGLNNASDMNTFIGFGSGNSNTTGRNNAFLGGNAGVLNVTGSNLTFLGYESGFNNINGANNTFGGSLSGRANTAGNDLTFWGFESGLSNTTGINNTFNGSTAGRTNTTGNDNSFFGFEAGFTNNRGDENVFCGAGAGFSNVDGSHNTFSGFEAGFSNGMDHENTYFGNISGRLLSSGTMNTFVGSQSGSAVSTASTTTLIGAGTSAANGLTNATALGFNASVVQRDNLILGNNAVRVGIGLSGNPVGPQTALEINTATPVTVGNSGLRFRTLTSASPSSATGVTRFLTLNINGDVILGDIPGVGGPISSCTGGLVNTDYITKISAFNEVCQTQGIYESAVSPFTIGLGKGSSVNSNFQVHAGGDLLIQPTVLFPGGDIYMQPLTGGTATQRVFAIFGSNGSGVLAVGPSAGNPVQSNSGSASGCTFIGKNAGIASLNALNCTFLGENSGATFTGTATAGIGNNTFIGTFSGSAVTGNDNSCLGTRSGATLATGNFNTLVGSQNSGGLSAGNDNVLVGYNAHFNSTTGEYNVLLGSRAHTYGSNISNSVSIGYQNRVECDNCVSIAAHVVQGSLPQQQVGIGFSNPSVQAVPGFPTVETKLYVKAYDAGNDAAYFAGEVFGSAFNVVSDSALKDSIQPLSGASALLDQIEPKSFYFRTQTYPNMGLLDGQHFGFLAQEIEPVIPNIVSYLAHPAEFDSSGNLLYPQVNFRTVNYSALIPVLVSALKEQKTLLDSLLAVVAQCCTPQPFAPGPEYKSTISLSDHPSIILNQNVPNPFRDKTEISWFVPESVSHAIIYFYDQNGRILNSFEIRETGTGSLVVFGDDLTSGMYTYALVAEGEPVITKRMIKE